MSHPQMFMALADICTQCTLMSSRYMGVESISISEVTGRSQWLTVLDAEVSLAGKEWQKHPVMTAPEAPCILGIDSLKTQMDVAGLLGSCSRDRGNQITEYPVWSLRQCLCCGTAKSGRTTGTNRHNNSAPSAILH